MKRTILIAVMMLGSVAAAQGDNYSNTNDGSLGTGNPYAGSMPTSGTIYEPGYRNACSMELTAFGALHCGKSDYFSPDMAGAELTLSKYFSKKQAVTISFAAAVGTDDQDYWDYDDFGYLSPYTNSYTRSDFSLMVGYRFKQPVGRYIELTAGVKAGLDVQYIDVDDEESRHHGAVYNAHGIGAGFGYAGYVQLGWRCSENAYFSVGYQFHGATTHPSARDDDWGFKYTTKAMFWHEIRLGLEFRF